MVALVAGSPSATLHFTNHTDGESIIILMAKYGGHLMRTDGPNNRTYEMNSRGDLVNFIYALQDELTQHPEAWENKDLHTYLGALARFIGDAHGYYRNAKLDVDANVPSWRLLADSLQAASVYD